MVNTELQFLTGLKFDDRLIAVGDSLDISFKTMTKIVSAIAYKKTIRETGNTADFQDVFQEVVLSYLDPQNQLTAEREAVLFKKTNGNKTGAFAIETARRAGNVIRRVKFSENNHCKEGKKIVVTPTDTPEDLPAIYYDEDQRKWIPPVLVIAEWIVNRNTFEGHGALQRVLNALIKTGAIGWTSPAVEFNGWTFIDAQNAPVDRSSYLRLSSENEAVFAAIVDKHGKEPNTLFDTGHAVTLKTVRDRARRVWLQSLAVYRYIEENGRPTDFDPAVNWKKSEIDWRRHCLTPRAIKTLRDAFRFALTMV